MTSVTVKNDGSASRTYYDARGRMVTIKAKQHATFNADPELVKRIESGAKKGDACSIIASDTPPPDKRTNEEALGELAEKPATTHVESIHDIPSADPGDPEGINTPPPVLDPVSEMDDGPGDADDAVNQDVAARTEAAMAPSTAGGATAVAIADRLEAALKPAARATAPARPTPPPARTGNRRR